MSTALLDHNDIALHDDGTSTSVPRPRRGRGTLLSRVGIRDSPALRRRAGIGAAIFTVVFLGLCAVGFLIAKFGSTPSQKLVASVSSGDVTLRLYTRSGQGGVHAEIADASSGVVKLVSTISARAVPGDLVGYDSPPAGDNRKQVHLKWEGGRTTTIGYVAGDEGCFHVQWADAGAGGQPPMDCVSMAESGQYWYGGAEMYSQVWPASKESLEWSLFASGDMWGNHSAYGSVYQARWLTTSGAGVSVDPRNLLMISMNATTSVAAGDKRLCFSPTPDLGTTEVYKPLSYKLCATDNALTMHQHFLAQTKHPTAPPDPKMIAHPVWSTWAKFKMAVNQTLVLSYAHDIVDHGFNCSQVEIDDRWSPYYGDLTWDPVKFPDPKAMIDELHSLGCRVTLWVMPFVNPDAAAFTVGTRERYFVREADGTTPKMVKWWHDDGAVIDFTNPSAVDWYTSRLRALQTDYGVDSFKFDAGEYMYTPPAPRTTFAPLNATMDLSRLYLSVAAEFAPLAEVRSGYDTQDLPIFVREFDKDSTWSTDNGLQALVTGALTFGVLGYPFVLPDMIGGNAYSNQTGNFYGNYPSRELYSRWAMANALLPAMQFSITPWHYDAETTALCLKATELHAAYAPMISELAHASTTSGWPIIRPLFWVDPTDLTAAAIGHEFMLGADVLVAPVMEKGATSRDVYLPAGTWQDVLRGGQHQGPTWLRGYAAALDELPYFLKVDAN